MTGSTSSCVHDQSFDPDKHGCGSYKELVEAMTCMQGDLKEIKNKLTQREQTTQQPGFVEDDAFWDLRHGTGPQMQENMDTGPDKFQPVPDIPPPEPKNMETEPDRDESPSEFVENINDPFKKPAVPVVELVTPVPVRKSDREKGKASILLSPYQQVSYYLFLTIFIIF